MKINRNNPKHWVYLFWTASLIILFVPFRFFWPKEKKRRTIILYGHKLHGNIHSIFKYFQKSKKDKSYINYYFLTLDPHYYHQLEKQYSNLLLALHPADLFKVVLSDCIISDHGLHSLYFLLKLTHIRFADTWHGIPFKGFIPNDFKLQHQYNEVWVSSQLLKDVYHEKFGFSNQQIHVTGYGRTDLILKYFQEKARYKSELGISLNKTVVLFAPTWKQDTKGRNEIPFDLHPNEFIKKLDEFAVTHNVALIVRYHLNTSQKKSINTQSTFFFPLDEFPDTEMIIAVSDVLITDWSSIAFDMMVIDKPIIFLDVPAPFQNGFSLPPSYRSGDVVKTFDDLTDSLNVICTDDKSYMQKHWQRYQQIKQDVYDDTLDGKTVERYIERLDSMLAHENRK